MKILVYGAGVLGCNLARNLFRAGKNVTLLAREKWAEEIKKERPADQGQVFTLHIGQPYPGGDGVEAGGVLRRDLCGHALYAV